MEEGGWIASPSEQGGRPRVLSLLESATSHPPFGHPLPPGCSPATRSVCSTFATQEVRREDSPTPNLPREFPDHPPPQVFPVPAPRHRRPDRAGSGVPGSSLRPPELRGRRPADPQDALLPLPRGGAQAQREARLAVRPPAAIRGGESGEAIVPGHHEESLLWERIEADEMPPGEKKLSAAGEGDPRRLDRRGSARRPGPSPSRSPPGPVFTEEERAFWSFQPIRRPESPSVGHPALGADPDRCLPAGARSRPRAGLLPRGRPADPDPPR